MTFPVRLLATIRTNPKMAASKDSLRRDILSRRRSLLPTWAQENSKVIVDKIVNWPQYKKAQRVMFYLAMVDEPSMDELISDALKTGKTVAVPHMGSKYGLMDAAVINSLDELVFGRLNLRVPNPDKLVVSDPNSLDLILVPGVAFDPRGVRLGMGAGYYDRFLQKACHAQMAGICWDFQLVSDLPQEVHDIPVQWIITEERLITVCGKGKM